MSRWEAIKDVGVGHFVLGCAAALCALLYAVLIPRWMRR